MKPPDHVYQYCLQTLGNQNRFSRMHLADTKNARRKTNHLYRFFQQMKTHKLVPPTQFSLSDSL